MNFDSYIRTKINLLEIYITPNSSFQQLGSLLPPPTLMPLATTDLSSVFIGLPVQQYKAFLFLAPFTEYNDFEIHPCCYM